MYTLETQTAPVRFAHVARCEHVVTVFNEIKAKLDCILLVKKYQESNTRWVLLATKTQISTLTVALVVV